MKVFEVLGIDSADRYGLEVSEVEAKRLVGTQNLDRYTIREVDLPVVFILVTDDGGWDEHVCLDEAYATLEAAEAASRPDQTIKVLELKS